MKSRGAVQVHEIRIRIPHQQLPRTLQLTIIRRHVQRCPAVHVGRIDSRPGLQQRGEHTGTLPQSCGSVQGCLPLRVSAPELSACRNHSPDCELVACRRRVEKLVVELGGRGGAASGAPLRDDLSLIHISEPTRLLSISYAVFCLKKKKRL
eukprot:TRINITY_DN7659_c0_g2_i2.p1 TRINITY_DN7659_c0_g2~~TRINITY_DN7659_c0_g2_i2.p1  ORF type:complete len:151 (+),score=25.18 TRINITY_DN7659_c0_g2_i2:699-1151(+)